MSEIGAGRRCGAVIEAAAEGFPLSMQMCCTLQAGHAGNHYRRQGVDWEYQPLHGAPVAVFGEAEFRWQNGQIWVSRGWIVGKLDDQYSYEATILAKEVTVQ